MYFIADVPVQFSYRILRPWNLSLLSQNNRLRSRDALSSNNNMFFEWCHEASTPPPSILTKTKRHRLRKSQFQWVRKDTYAAILVTWQFSINHLSINEEKLFISKIPPATHTPPHTTNNHPHPFPPSFISINTSPNTRLYTSPPTFLYPSSEFSYSPILRQSEAVPSSSTLQSHPHLSTSSKTPPITLEHWKTHKIYIPNTRSPKPKRRKKRWWASARRFLTYLLLTSEVRVWCAPADGKLTAKNYWYKAAKRWVSRRGVPSSMMLKYKAVARNPRKGRRIKKIRCFYSFPAKPKSNITYLPTYQKKITIIFPLKKILRSVRSNNNPIKNIHRKGRNAKGLLACIIKS